MRSLLFAVMLLLAGCAGSPKALQKETVQLGVIESVTPIKLDDSSNVGTNVGGIFGQAGGAGSGGGSGAAVGSIFGAVFGSTLGREAGIATKPGLEIWVKLDESGKSTYVMQPGKPEAFKVGDPVRVIRNGNAARVEPALLGAPPAAEPPAEQ